MVSGEYLNFPGKNYLFFAPKYKLNSQTPFVILDLKLEIDSSRSTPEPGFLQALNDYGHWIITPATGWLYIT